jgi:uncharacterized membrane protein YkoI
MVAVGGAALSAYQIRKTSEPPSSAVQKVSAQKDTLPDHLDGLMPAASVQDVAANAGGSPVADMSLENRSGVLVYLVTLSDGTALSFNATSGEAVALANNQAPPQEKRDHLPANFVVNTSFEKARQLAQDAFPNGKIKRIQLRTDGASVVMSVSFADKAQVDINAANGNVIRVTTPTGATAEAPTEANSSSPDNPAPSTSKSPDSTQEPSPADDATAPDHPAASDRAMIRVEGTLTLANGIYTITDDGDTYIVQTDQDISNLVGKTVRVVGKLQGGTTLQAVSVVPRR